MNRLQEIQQGAIFLAHCEQLFFLARNSVSLPNKDRSDQVITTQQKQDEDHQLSVGSTVFLRGISSLFLDAGPTQEEKRSPKGGGRRVTTYVYHLFEEWPQRDLGGGYLWKSRSKCQFSAC